MMKAVLFGAFLFIAYEFAVGEVKTMWCGIICIQSFVVAWVLYQKPFVEPVSSPEKYQLVFVLLTMIVCYYVIGEFLEVNRDFMVRSKGMTHLLEKQEVALHEET